VAIYSITLISLFLVVAQFFFSPLAPWPVFLQKAVLQQYNGSNSNIDFA